MPVKEEVKWCQNHSQEKSIITETFIEYGYMSENKHVIVVLHITNYCM